MPHYIVTFEIDANVGVTATDVATALEEAVQKCCEEEHMDSGPVLVSHSHMDAVAD